jgi:hypothetical protein
MKGKAPLRESRISMGEGRLPTTRKHARKNSDRAIAPDPFQRGLMNFVLSFLVRFFSESPSLQARGEHLESLKT